MARQSFSFFWGKVSGEGHLKDFNDMKACEVSVKMMKEEADNKIERNQTRDKEEQHKLASMVWPCITVWECQLKPKVRVQTLQSLDYILNHIYLQDHNIKRYKLHEEECVIAAEPSLMYNRIADGTSCLCLENETSKL